MVISHAGVGAAVTAIEAGKCPVLVPRLSRHGEHIDDHQTQIADELTRRGLAIRADPERLDAGVLSSAAARTTIAVGAPRFELDATPARAGRRFAAGQPAVAPATSAGSAAPSMSASAGEALPVPAIRTAAGSDG